MSGQGEASHGTVEMDAEPERRVGDERDLDPIAAFTDAEVRNAYTRGISSGYHALAPDSFEEYLRLSVQERAVESRLELLEKQKIELSGQLTEARQLRESAARAALDAELREQRIGQVEKELSAVEEDLESLEVARKEVLGKGRLTHGFIYCLAALTFVMADVVITRNIVADALAMTGNKILGLDEGWYFAFALALIAVLLKPAYDRLVEDRYWDAKPVAFNIVILVTSVLAIATIVVLGIFRGVAYEAQTKAEMQEDMPGLTPEQTWHELVNLQERIVESHVGKAAFIMSGVLFAIAGAISLGVALRQFHDWKFVRCPVMQRVKAAKKRKRGLERKLSGLIDEQTGALLELKRMETAKQIGPQMSELQDQLDLVRDSIQTLLEEHARIRQERLTSIFENGYARGARMKESAASRSRPGRHRRRPRPFVAVRKQIREEYLKNVSTAR